MASSRVQPRSPYSPGTRSIVSAPASGSLSEGMMTASQTVMYPRSDATPFPSSTLSSCSTPQKSTQRHTLLTSHPFSLQSFFTAAPMSLCLVPMASSGCAIPAHSCPSFSHSSLVCHGLSHLWLMNTILQSGTSESSTVLLSDDRGILPCAMKSEKRTTRMGASGSTEPHRDPLSSAITSYVCMPSRANPASCSLASSGVLSKPPSASASKWEACPPTLE
mmetsp:Transcript_32621/g.80067  ORF Transcript_32621/g.80067 Transcript_32621/m.80067 type:complete len:220 (-) Transcript_32621:367-1026(-)